MRKCSLFVAVVAVVLAVGLTAAYASHQTSREIEVKLMKVGEKGKTLKNNGKEHSFTLKDLSDGKTEYWIKKDKKAYLVQMVRDDIVTLAGGETITVLVLPAMEVDTSDDSDAIAGLVAMTSLPEDAPTWNITMELKEKRTAPRPSMPSGGGGGGGW